MTQKVKAARTITGIDKIEDYLKRSAPTLISWKRDFDFPMDKINGVMTLDLAAFDTWRREWKFNPRTTTETDLEAVRLARSQQERLRQMPDRTICGFIAMAKFAGRGEIGDIISWSKNWTDWPGFKNDANQPCVNSRQFQAWLEKHGFRRDAHPAAMRRLRHA